MGTKKLLRATRVFRSTRKDRYIRIQPKTGASPRRAAIQKPRDAATWRPADNKNQKKPGARGERPSVKPEAGGAWAIARKTQEEVRVNRGRYRRHSIPRRQLRRHLGRVCARPVPRRPPLALWRGQPCVSPAQRQIWIFDEPPSSEWHSTRNKQASGSGSASTIGITNIRPELLLRRNQLYATRGRTQSCRMVPVDRPCCVL